MKKEFFSGTINFRRLYAIIIFGAFIFLSSCMQSAEGLKNMSFITTLFLHG